MRNKFGESTHTQSDSSRPGVRKIHLKVEMRKHNVALWKTMMWLKMGVSESKSQHLREIYLSLLQMNLLLLIIEMNRFIIVIGCIMWIHHHYALFNTEQTFDPLPLIYHDKRQTNLSRATLRNRPRTCGVHTWWSWHKQRTDSWVVFSLYEKKEGATLLFSLGSSITSVLGIEDSKTEQREKTTAKTVTSAALSMLPLKLTTRAFSNSFLLLEKLFISHFQCPGSKCPSRGAWEMCSSWPRAREQVPLLCEKGLPGPAK